MNMVFIFQVDSIRSWLLFVISISPKWSVGIDTIFNLVFEFFVLFSPSFLGSNLQQSHTFHSIPPALHSPHRLGEGDRQAPVRRYLRLRSSTDNFTRTLPRFSPVLPTIQYLSLEIIMSKVASLPTSSTSTTTMNTTTPLDRTQVLPKRQSSRLNKPSPFLLLSAELVDLILTHLLQLYPNERRQNLQLQKLFPTTSLFVPFIRRKLWSRTTVIIGDKKEKAKKLLEILNLEEGSKMIPPGELVRAIKFRSPEPGTAKQAFTAKDIEEQGELLRTDPGAFLVARHFLSQDEVLATVVKVLGKCRRLRNLSLETRVGTKDEHLEGGYDGSEDLSRKLDALLVEIKGIEVFTIAVATPSQSLQILSNREGWISPLLPALATWDNLTILRLWRINFELPQSGNLLPSPLFRLHELELVSANLGGEAELVFLLGPGQGEGSERGAALRNFVIREITFTSTPTSSDPFLAVIGPSCAIANSLTSFELSLQHPFSDDVVAGTLLSSFTALKTLEIGDPGITPALFQSLFPIPSQSAKPPAPAPSQSLEEFRLTYTISLPHSLVIDSMSTVSHFSNLKTFDLRLAGTHPRSWTWLQMSTNPVPLWDWDSLSQRTMVSHWDEFRRSLGKKWGSESGLQVRKNGMSIELAEESASSEDEDEDEVDGEALFVPTSDWERDPNEEFGELASGDESDF
ncbi:hypothetical protein T439DRAFT_350347 [Meredithblackwellia eburnea MCA 4105]